MLTEYNTDSKQRTVINVSEVKLNTMLESVGIAEQAQKNDFKFNIFPNPTTTQCQLNYDLKIDALVTVSVYNMLGVLVYSETRFENAGNVSHELIVVNLQQGNYSVEVSTKEFKTVKKLTVIN